MVANREKRRETKEKQKRGVDTRAKGIRRTERGWPWEREWW